jgi:hypothetical protein
MTCRSALYVGFIVHRRLRPRAHHLRYSAFWLWLDLDEADRLSDRLRLFSHNRFNALSFHDADHGDCSGAPLRDQVEAHLRAAGIETAGGPIRLLCMPRVFGYVFNPLSVYFCFRCDESLAALLYEVRNTFGERHSYLIPVSDDAGPVIVQHCQKLFYVSPFMDMDVSYAFRVAIPTESVSIAVEAVGKDGPLLTAALSGRRVTLTDMALLRALITHPALTLKVIAAIHWHAIRMLLKGFRLRSRPRPPREAITVVSAGGSPPWLP